MTQRLKYLLMSFALLSVLLVFDRVSQRRMVISNDDVTIKDSLIIQMGMRSGFYGGKGHPQGFNYQLLTDCSKDMGKYFKIPYVRYQKQSLDALVQGSVDIVAIDVRDTSYMKYKEDVMITSSFYNYAWAVSRENPYLLKMLNLWLSKQHGNGYLAKMYNRYFSSYDLKPYLATMTTRTQVSPYDAMIKEYSVMLGWDWRLLAAVLKKESRFSIGAHSSRGAMGLMQVLPQTASIYGVVDCYSPSENIKAGTSFLRDIKNDYEGMGLDSANVVKFTLAAYNAGQSRMRDCIIFAKEQGTDPYDWDSVSRVIPLMALPEYYENAEYLRHGPFSGKETITYVRDILAAYDQYLQAVRP